MPNKEETADRKKCCMHRLGWLRLLLLALILGGFVLYLARNPEQIPNPEELDWRFFGLIIALSALANGAAAAGYAAIARETGCKLKTATIMRVFLIGRCLNLFSPQGGTVYSAVYLKNTSNFSYTKFSASCASMIWFDLTLAFSSACIALSFTSASFQRDSLLTLFALAFVGSSLTIWLTRHITQTGKLRALSFLPERLHSRLAEFAETITELMTKRKLCLTFSGWTTLNTVLHGFRLWLCFIMFAQYLSWPNAYTTTIVVKASNTLSITPGNLGIIETIVGLMGSSFGLDMTVAVLAGLTYRFSSYIALIAMSILLIIRGSDHTTRT